MNFFLSINWTLNIFFLRNQNELYKQLAISPTQGVPKGKLKDYNESSNKRNT